MLSLRGVSKDFGGFRALDSVDLEVAPGEVVALVGANGAGKSTLIKVLGGLYPDARYRCTIESREVALSSPTSAIAAGIGIVHQEIDLSPNLTVAENMLLGHEPTTRLPLGFALLRRRELETRAEQILSDIGFVELRAGDKVVRLPIEMRQLVQVARILALDAKVVVFDEPTARLSAQGRARLFSVIEKLRGAGKMIVLVSHYLEEVFAAADRVVVLRDGRMVKACAIGELDMPGLIKHMLGDVVIDRRQHDERRGEATLRARGLTSEPHFRGVNFEARSFEVLGLTGIVGSGRHELIRSLIGAHPAKGDVEIAGKPIARESPAQVVGRHLGFAPEDRKADGIFADLSIGDNLGLPWLRALSTAGVVSDSRVRQRAVALIERLRIACSSRSQPAGQLSGGNQQKVVLGRWFGSRLPVVILESPTVGVDVAGKQEILRLVRTLARDGMAVVVSTDDQWELEQLTDRILVMVRGEIRKEFETSSMSRDDLMSCLAGYVTPSSVTGAHERR
jgi:ABC-type sugar transport system ATPase subunit